MTEAIDPKLLDKRIYKRFVKSGLLTEKDFERHLKSLPDLEEHASRVEATIEPTRMSASGIDSDEE